METWSEYFKRDWPRIFLAVGLMFLLFSWLIPTTEAFHPSQAGGCSRVQVNALVGGGRVFLFANEDAVDFSTAFFTCRDTSNPLQDLWFEMDAGSSIDLKYLEDTDGLSPPPTAFTVRLRVRYDHEAASTIITHHLGAPPANGTIFTFWATDDGTATGTPIAGTLRPFIEVVRDEVVDANDYNCNSDGNVVVGSARSCTTIAGFLRSHAICSSVVASSPPAGSHFAYGAASNEDVTITITRTKAFQAISGLTETLRVIDSTNSVVETGSATNWDTAASHADSFTIDNTYPNGLATYGSEGVIAGTSALSTLAWTEWADSGHGSGCNRISSSVVRDTDVFQANPQVWFDSDGFGPPNNVTTTNFDSYNRNENVVWDTFLLNSRNEQLTRSITFQVRDVDTSTLVDTHIGTGPNYGDTFLLAATDPATNSTVIGEGTDYRIRASNSDLTAFFSDAAFEVFSRYLTDCHTQSTAALMKDPITNKNAAEVSTFNIAADTVRTWTNVSGIRGDTPIQVTGSRVHVRILDPTSVVQDHDHFNTGSDGWTTSHQSFATIPPSGTWNAICSIEDSDPFNGNTAYDVQIMQMASPYTEPFVIEFYHEQIIGPGQRFTIVIEHFEKGASSLFPVTPSNVPTIEVRCLTGDNPLGLAEVTPTFSPPNLRNTDDNTTSLTTGRWWIGLRVQEESVCSATVLTQFQGTDINRQTDFSISSVGGAGVMTVIGGYVLGDALEIGSFFLIGLWAFWQRLPLAGAAAWMAVPRPFFPDVYPISFEASVFLLMVFLGTEMLIIRFRANR